jgi:hypothetical protein
MTVSLAVLFQGGPVVDTPFERVVHYTKVCWVLSVPYFITQYISSYQLLDEGVLIEPSQVDCEKLKDSKVIFTILTLGRNLETLRDTARSNNYWISRTVDQHGLAFTHETWIVTEEDGYNDREEAYDELKRLGARIIVVPNDYSTPNNTLFKARALQYATETRGRLGYSTQNTWIYHQDEETMLGEDTVLGILDFITNPGESVMGSGIILYPQDWTKNYLSIQETTRSANDMGLVGQIKTLGYSLLGYHGSHFLIRADIEEKIGWDFGFSRSEDLVFSIKVKHKIGSVMKPLKGFEFSTGWSRGCPLCPQLLVLP